MNERENPKVIARRCLEFYFLGLGQEVPSIIESVAAAIQKERDRAETESSELVKDVEKALNQVADLEAALAKEKKVNEQLAKQVETVQIDLIEKLEAELAEARDLIKNNQGNLEQERVGWNKTVLALRERERVLVEALNQYGEHAQECIRNQFQAGQPTADGGYEQLFGYGKDAKWYRVKPVDESPKCTCGFDNAIALTSPKPGQGEG